MGEPLTGIDKWNAELPDRWREVRAQVERLQRAEEARDVAQAGRNTFVERAKRAEAAISSVRALHSPVAGEGDTQWCSVCSQEEQQPAPIGWWVPWPCPTIAALDSSATVEDAPEEDVSRVRSLTVAPNTWVSFAGIPFAVAWHPTDDRYYATVKVFPHPPVPLEEIPIGAAAQLPEERSDELRPRESAPGAASDRAFVACQLPIGWEWCALRIGHDGPCDPAPERSDEGQKKHASPNCACGINDAGQRYVDPICRERSVSGLPVDGETPDA